MHHSRLSTILIDCAESDYDAGVTFWSAALGREAIPEPDDPRYASLRGRLGGEGGPYVTLQRVAAEERAIHLDIETDDVEAEVARLEKLGARVKRRLPEHVVLTAPSGHAFCVVPKLRGDFPGDAARWGE
jgi:predicted enzyme related to lactoylglutathione lyase